MLRPGSLLVALLVAVPLSARAQPAPAVPEACDASADFATPADTLDHLTQGLKAGGPINILAVGSGTTVGETDGTPGASFPYRMVDALKAALPKVTFRLTVRGGRNMTAEAMLPLLTQELSTQHFPLVLWQTATVEAVRGMRPDLLQAVLEAGVDAVRDAGGDVVLIDPQFSRFLRANVDLDPYEAVLEQVADLQGVVLFHRFDLMRSWATAGQIDLERVRKADRESAVAVLNACLGQTLARFVMNGAGVTPH
jgi:acyl-CoA thioesterase I